MPIGLSASFLFAALLAAAPAREAAPAGDAGLPVFFVPNRGQADSSGSFIMKSADLTAHFHLAGVDLHSGALRVRLRFLNGRASRIEGTGRLSGVANFLIGRDPKRWKSRIPTFSGIVYRDLYPGIDAVYDSVRRRLKSEFVVHPGADPAFIRLAYEGADEVSVAPDGSLLIRTAGGDLREEAPVVYQEIGGRRIAVAGSYSVAQDGSVGFDVGEYDRAIALVIDPVLVSSTFLGGSRQDAATGVAADASGAVYVAGWTESYDFPPAGGGRPRSASIDAFVAKLSAAGSSLVYTTFIGGRGEDRAFAIGVDSSGRAVIAGYTTSPDFPLASPAQGAPGGGRDAFVAQLDAAGAGLVLSTYLGGAGNDAANGVAVDAQGNLYAAGEAGKGFPFLAAFQQENRGLRDAFAVKFSSSGRLLWSTLLGGSADDRATAVAIDGSGAVYLTGCTDSADFPTRSALQNSRSGAQDAFVAKFLTGGGLAYSTYLGGSGGNTVQPECGNGIAVDSQGIAYVTGVTSSVNFPLVLPVQAALQGYTDAFVARINASGTAILRSTYLGGTGADYGYGIALDAWGYTTVSGRTSSRDFPLNGTIQYSNHGDNEVFLARFPPNGYPLDFSTYLGGAGSDSGTALAIAPSGRILVAGLTQSPDFPLLNPVQTSNGGNYGAFVSAVMPDYTPSVVSAYPASGAGATAAFTWTFSDANGASDIASAAILLNSTPAHNAACSLRYTSSGDALWLYDNAGANWLGPLTPGVAGTVQNSQCSIDGAAAGAVRSGNNLALTVTVAFTVSFTGTKNQYLSVTDTSARTSGWVTAGTFAVTDPTVNVAPAAVSVSPASGSGSAVTFQAVYSDGNGAQDFRDLYVMVNGSLSYAHGCVVARFLSSSRVSLMNDAGTGWIDGTMGTGTLENSQCTVNLAGMAVQASGLQITLTLPVVFKSAFTGLKTVYLLAYDQRGANSGWGNRGSWTPF